MAAAGQGVLVVFEGGEGAGKDTVIAHLKERLAHRTDLVYTREPGGTSVGERIRSVLMDPAAADMAVEAELMLFLAARAQLVREIILPALAAGSHVIANRFGLSTIAYQIYRKERHDYRSFLDDLSARIIGDIVPHYILLDVPPEVGLARTRARPGEVTRFDVEPLESHVRVRTGYRDAVRAFPHTIIDASRPQDEVQEAVFTHVTSLIGL